MGQAEFTYVHVASHTATSPPPTSAHLLPPRRKEPASSSVGVFPLLAYVVVVSACVMPIMTFIRRSTLRRDVHGMHNVRVRMYQLQPATRRSRRIRSVRGHRQNRNAESKDKFTSSSTSTPSWSTSHLRNSRPLVIQGLVRRLPWPRLVSYRTRFVCTWRGGCHNVHAAPARSDLSYSSLAAAGGSSTSSARAPRAARA